MKDDRKNTLFFAIRGRVILKYSGELALVLAVLILPMLAVAFAQQDWTQGTRYLVLSVFLCAGGVFLTRLPAPRHIQANEALTLTALGFICAPLLMVWPIMSEELVFSDALFEAVSGVTTTGLTTLTNIEGYSANFLFARAWMQWYGGLGIIVLSVALLMGHHATGLRLANPVVTSEMLASSMRIHARRSLIIYASLTLLGLGLIWPLTGNGFTALLHVLSAVSTGGFSSYDNSLAGLASGPAAVAVMGLSFLGAISLQLYWHMFHAGWLDGVRTFLADVELRALLISCLLAGGLLGALGSLNGVETPWYHGFMNGFSAQTTTGFSTLEVADLDPASKLVMITSMLVGGSVGSSAGGFKLLRLLILIRLLQVLIQRASMPPHAVAEPYLGGQKLDTDDIVRALQLILLFIGISVLSWLPFLAMGYDPLDALFEVVSACGTVGLSSGISRPELEPILKGVLCFDMLAGRVEIIALLVVLYPRNWFGRHWVEQ